MLPLSFVDEHLPTLSDTEARLFLVVARQTLGWATKDGERKEWDWLSHSELRRRTGRSGDSVSKAIAALSARGLIRVGDKAGNPLTSAAKRRGNFGKLYFALSPKLPSSLSSFQKVETTKENHAKEILYIRKLRNAAFHVNTGWQRVGNLIEVSQPSSSRKAEGGGV